MGVAGVEGFGIDAFVFVVVVVVSLVLVVGVGVDVGCGEHDGIDLVHHHGVSLGTRESGGGERGEVTAVELQTLGLGEDVERLEGCGAIGGVRLGARASAASMLRGGAELVPGRAERGEGAPKRSPRDAGDATATSASAPAMSAVVMPTAVARRPHALAPRAPSARAAEAASSRASRGIASAEIADPPAEGARGVSSARAGTSATSNVAISFVARAEVSRVARARPALRQRPRGCWEKRARGACPSTSRERVLFHSRVRPRRCSARERRIPSNHRPGHSRSAKKTDRIPLPKRTNSRLAPSA